MRYLRYFVGILLIILGIAMIYYVYDNKKETNLKQTQMKEYFESQINNLGEIAQSDEDNEETKVDEEVIESPVENQTDMFENVDGQIPIAIIEIPSIELSQVLVEGASDEILQYYLGHIENTPLPGENGNCVIAGHRVSDYAEAFINLYKVEIGDKINVRTKNNNYTYIVNDKFIVDPTAVEVMDNTEDDIMTLITCTVGAKQRVIVRALLEK